MLKDQAQVQLVALECVYTKDLSSLLSDTWHLQRACSSRCRLSHSKAKGKRPPTLYNSVGTYSWRLSDTLTILWWLQKNTGSFIKWKRRLAWNPGFELVFYQDLRFQIYISMFLMKLLVLEQLSFPVFLRWGVNTGFNQGRNLALLRWKTGFRMNSSTDLKKI